MSRAFERVRGVVARRVVRAGALAELAERVDEVAEGARENAALARGLEQHLDALEAEVAAVVSRREG